MEVTEKTVQFSGGKDANYLRTLAAAYAEVGQFSETIATAEQALQIATAQGKSGSATILEKEVILYRAHTPLREPGAKN
jgi:hypothetical protein